MADSSITQLSFPEADIAVLTFDDPNKGANVLSSSVLDEIEKHLDVLDAKEGLAGLILISGKPGMFIAGADLREFIQWLDSPKEEVIGFSQRGHKLFGRLASCDYVTIAAIDGLCLGGGTELTLWCDRRIFSNSPKTNYGLPEVKLGLFPGWGGTARLPRMVGLSNAVEMITGGEPIKPKAAAAMQLAQDVVPAEELLPAAIRMVRMERDTNEYFADRKTWSAPIEISETELGFLGATASAYIQQVTKGQYPAPMAALEIILGGTSVDIEAACEMEADAFAEIFGSPVNRSLLNVFFLQDQNKKARGVGKGVAEQTLKSVSVIGAGIMGQGIAAVNIKRGLPVTLSDASEEALGRGVQQVLEEASFDRETKAPSASKMAKLATILNGSTSDAEVCSSDLVVEAIIENLDIKKQVFAKLEPQMRDDAILASNTSTIPITQMAADLKHPERFCGLHFFNPVRKMPLVEVIRGEKTSDETVATLVAYAKKLGKSPVVVGDAPGFLVNRLLLPYMNESLQLVVEGASLREVDKAATTFGMPMGPITLFDVVGLDTSVHAGLVLYTAYPTRIIPSELLTALYKADRLGQKNGKGFYVYGGKKKRGAEDPIVTKMIAERVDQPKKFTREELIDRMFLPMILEATRVLEEGVVKSPQDVDLGLIYGIGFPPFKGGLLFWADTLGAKAIVEKLKPYDSFGERYQPTQMLLDMAAKGSSFYPQR